MKTLHIPTLITVLLALAPLHLEAAQAESKALAAAIARCRAINENAVVARKKLRNHRLTLLLYDELTSLPMDLIKIIASYDYLFEGSMYTVAINPRNYGDVEQIKIINNNNSLLIRHFTSTITLWNIHTGTCEMTYTPEDLRRLAETTPLSSLPPIPKTVIKETPHERATVNKLLWKHNPIWPCLELSHHRVALAQSIPQEAEAEPNIIISSTLTGKTLHTLSGHHRQITELVELPEELLASASADHTIQIWDLTSGARLHILQTIQPVRHLVVTQDGKLVAVFKHGSFQVFV